MALISISNRWAVMRVVVTATITFFLTFTTVAEESAQALNTRICAPEGIGLGGYDAISYYQADAPQLGDETISVEHNGLTYLFVNLSNQRKFELDPEKFLPTYRGWCAATLSMGRLACPDYTNFKFENGDLLLFERIGFSNGRNFWDSDPEKNRLLADKNFQILSTE